MQIKKIFLTAIAVFGMAVAANATSVKGGTTPDSEQQLKLQNTI